MRAYEKRNGCFDFRDQFLRFELVRVEQERNHDDNNDHHNAQSPTRHWPAFATDAVARDVRHQVRSRRGASPGIAIAFGTDRVNE